MQALAHHCCKLRANGGDCAEKERFVAENLFYQTVLLCSLYWLLFPWKQLGGTTFGAAFVYAPKDNSSLLSAAQASQKVGWPKGWDIHLSEQAIKFLLPSPTGKFCI